MDVGTCVCHCAVSTVHIVLQFQYGELITDDYIDTTEYCHKRI